MTVSDARFRVAPRKMADPVVPHNLLWDYNYRKGHSHLGDITKGRNATEASLDIDCFASCNQWALGNQILKMVQVSFSLNSSSEQTIVFR